MLANFDWFRSTFSNLSDDTQRIQLLRDLKIAIGVLDNNHLLFLSQHLPLNEVFDCLNSSDRDQVEVTCDVLALLLSPIHIDVIITQYGSMLFRALGHPITRVKEMVIKELDLATPNDVSVLRLCQQPDLLAGIAGCVGVDEPAVGAAVVRLLVKLGTTTVGLSVLYSETVLLQLKQAMEEDAVIRFRVYEVVSDICVSSPMGLAASESHGLLGSLLAELQGRDVLVQLNAMELLTRLALTPHGLRYLEQGGVVDALAARLAALDCETPDPLAAFHLPGLIKFFGNVAQEQPQQVLERYPHFVSVLRHTAAGADPVVANVAMETVGYVGSTLRGKAALDSLDNTMPELLSKLGVQIATMQTEYRVIALNIVANLLQLKEDERNEPALSLTQRWFSNISAAPTELVVGICRLPFPELRLAGLQVAHVLAGQRWGQQCLNSVPGVLEFLTDRTQEPNKMCLDSKFEIVKTLVESSTTTTVLSTESMKRLKEYMTEGPYFVRPQTQVAIENVSA